MPDFPELRIRKDITDPEKVEVPKRSSITTARTRGYSEDVVLFESLKCFPQVKELIVSGWPPAKIAGFMVENFSEDFDKMDRSEEDLASLMSDYRKRLKPAELMSIRMPEEIMKAKDRLSTGINVMAEMEELYKIQKARIAIDYNSEKAIGKLFKTTGNEIEIATRMLREYYEIRKGLGIDKVESSTDEIVRKRMIGDFAVKYGKESVSKVLTDPSKVTKVLKFADSLFENLSTGDAMKLLEDKKAEISETLERIESEA